MCTQGFALVLSSYEMFGCVHRVVMLVFYIKYRWAEIPPQIQCEWQVLVSSDTVSTCSG